MDNHSKYTTGGGTAKTWTEKNPKLSRLPRIWGPLNKSVSMDPEPRHITLEVRKFSRYSRSLSSYKPEPLSLIPSSYVIHTAILSPLARFYCNPVGKSHIYPCLLQRFSIHATQSTFDCLPSMLLRTFYSILHDSRLRTKETAFSYSLYSGVFRPEGMNTTTLD